MSSATNVSSIGHSRREGDSSLSVAYSNVNGMSGDVLRWVQRLLQKGVVQIVVVVEHWFVNWDAVTSSPFFIATSNRFEGSAKRNRAQGGVAVFAIPTLKQQLAHVVSGIDWVKVSWSSFSLAGVYLPPSLPEDAAMSLLTSVGDATIVAGDFNVRWWEREGKRHSDGRKRTNEPRSRAESIATWATLNTLEMVPYPGPCRLDQVWVDTSLLSCDYASAVKDLALPFKTDHPGFSFTFATALNVNKSEENFATSTRRLRIGLLDDSLTCATLVDKYRIIAPIVVGELSSAEERVRTHSNRLELKSIVDRVDLVLLESLMYIAEDTLGCYTPRVERQYGDKVRVELSTRTDSLSAQRLWKKAQRGNSRPIVASSGSNQTASQEVVDYWGSIWGKDDEATPFDDSKVLFDSSDQAPLALLSNKDVWTCIRSYPCDRSPGQDGLHCRILFTLAPSVDSLFVVHLARFFRLCGASQYFPKRWGHSLVTLIPKEPEGNPIASTTRPISLVPMFRRLFESLLIPYLTDNTHTCTRLNFGQAGFRKGFSCISNLISIDWASRGNNKKIFIFLDFKAAYDTPSFPVVLDELSKRGFSKQWIVLLASFLESGASASIVVNGSVTPRFKRSRGLPQGAPIAPLVFNLFADSLVSALNESASIANPDSLFFADDGAILAKDLGQAQLLLATAERWAKDHGMIFNVKKCGVVSSIRDLDLQLQGERLSQVDSYKYLGLPFTSRGIDFVSWLNNKVAQQESSLRYMMVKGVTWHPLIRLTLYKSFVRPLLDYAGPLLHHYLEGARGVKRDIVLKSATEHWKSAVSWICHVNAENSAKVCCAMTGITPPSERIASLSVNLRVHLTESASPDSPARCRLSQVVLGNGFNSELIPWIQNNKRYREFVLFCRTKPDLDLRSALLSYQLGVRREFLGARANVGRLGLYLASSSESRTSALFDCVFRISERHDLHLATRWRSGIFGIRHSCKCGDPFNRRHAVECYEGLILQEADKVRSGGSQLVRDTFVKERDTKYLQAGLSFTLLDSMLNSNVFRTSAIKSLDLIYSDLTGDK